MNIILNNDSYCSQRESFLLDKAAYGIGDLGNSVGPGTVIPFWYTIFLTDVVRLDLRLVSLFWLVVTVWDAINDPLFGFLSDRTRWGRRLEKKMAYGCRLSAVIAAATWAVVMLTILWIPRGAKVLACVLAPLSGFGVAAAHPT